MIISNQLSNYIYDRAPNVYKGEQSQYIQQRNQIIADVETRVINEISEKKDLKKTFFDVLDIFAQMRHTIAMENKTDEGNFFGVLRTNTDLLFSKTKMIAHYENFNATIIQQIQKMLKGKIPNIGELKQKEFKEEQTFSGRKCSFEVKILTCKEVKDAELFKKVPSIYDITFDDKNINNEPRHKISNLSLNLTELEKESLNQFQAKFKYIKDKHSNYYSHSKFYFPIQMLESISPTPEIILEDDQVTIKKINGEMCHIKSFYLFAKVRVQIKNKMYALSEYVTWMHKNPMTDPVENLQKSKVIILHQDYFLIEETLSEIACLFQQILAYDDKKLSENELKNLIGQMRYLFAHCMPYCRGSAAIAEWLEILMYKLKGYQCQHNSETLGDLEALTAPMLGTFMNNYDRTIKLKKIN